MLATACSSGPESPQWTEAFDATDIGWFMNVWGPAEDNLYAVGGAPDSGVIMHYDGTAWTALDVGVQVPLINWAYGFGPDNVTMVGIQGTVLHWDGSAWEIQDTPTIEDLWGVWGAAPDDLWAVGGRGREAGQATLLHYDGAAWTQYEIPELVRANVYAFFKVWGTGANNIYVVGQHGVVLHWDGQEWTEELVGANDDLVSLWGSGPDRIMAVGGRASGIVSLWNGTEWRTESLAPLPGLNGIWMQDDGLAHVVGTVGTVITLDVETFEIEKWQTGAYDDFHSVFSATGEKLVAVGGNLFAVGGPYQGIAYRRELGIQE